MTPRKAQRHSKKPSQSNLSYQVQPSDYESEAPIVTSSTRSNTELNLSVLKRYSPDITQILSIAPAAVIYNFVNGQWEKAELEGTLFVCQLLPTSLAGQNDRYNVVILNKKALDNLILEMSEVKEVEITPDLLILRWTDDSGDKTVGIYIHPDQVDTREVNCRIIKECWESVAEKENVEEPTQYGGDVFEDSDGQFAGKNLSVNQLFGR